MLYNNPMIKIKTIRYLFEAILGINLLIITRILGLKLSSRIFSWVFSNLGPKLNISNQAKENLLSKAVVVGHSAASGPRASGRSRWSLRRP